MLKKRIGRAIPYPLIAAGRRAIHAGRHRCPVCDGRYRRLFDSGYGHDVLERLQVVGGMRRGADRCPLCHATARERLIAFWLDRARLPDAPRIAHFAPEKGLTKRLRAISPRYRAYDAEPARYRHLPDVDHADLCALHMDTASTDLVICNHVLEHVPDADLAMRELFRVLASGGIAILQVPIALNLEHTIELGVESSAGQRIEKLGQDDHLRLFSRGDYLSRLGDAGFDVEQYRAFDHAPEAATRWLLDPFETLFVCRRR